MPGGEIRRKKHQNWAESSKLAVGTRDREEGIKKKTQKRNRKGKPGTGMAESYHSWRQKNGGFGPLPHTPLSTTLVSKLSKMGGTEKEEKSND